MKIIVRLGQSRQEYEKSRHNAGFMVVDRLAEQLGCQFKTELISSAMIAKTDQFVLIKPQTFMNDSGRAVQSWLHYYKKIIESGEYPDLAVLYDDLDIPFGSWKWQFGTGPKAHNGVNSVVAHLNTDQFWHGRIGTENRKEHRLTMPSDAYVLTPFVEDEQLTLSRVLEEITGQVLRDW